MHTTERESALMELLWNPIERAGVPSGRQRIPTDRARTAIELQRTPIGRARTPRRNAWTAIVAQRVAFRRARVARLAPRPQSRTTASRGEQESAWPDLSNPSLRSGQAVPERCPHPLTPSPRCGEGERKEAL